MLKLTSHNNFFVFTGSLVVLLLCSAIASSSPDETHRTWLQVVLFGVQLVAYFSLNLSPQWRKFVVVAVGLLLLANILRSLTEWEQAPLSGLVVYFFFLTGMTYFAAKQALFTGNIEPNTIAGTVAVYLLLGLVWAFLYLICLEIWPNAFHGLAPADWNDNLAAATYFSYVTMTTLGYGDISPTVPASQVLAALQAVAGTFYMAVVVASLISALGRRRD